MKIQSLVENTPVNEALADEHETSSQVTMKVIFDATHDARAKQMVLEAAETDEFNQNVQRALEQVIRHLLIQQMTKVQSGLDRGDRWLDDATVSVAVIRTA